MSRDAEGEEHSIALVLYTIVQLVLQNDFGISIAKRFWDLRRGDFALAPVLGDSKRFRSWCWGFPMLRERRERRGFEKGILLTGRLHGVKRSRRWIGLITFQNVIHKYFGSVACSTSPFTFYLTLSQIRDVFHIYASVFLFIYNLRCTLIYTSLIIVRRDTHRMIHF
jgi:hypothetical protein